MFAFILQFFLNKTVFRLLIASIFGVCLKVYLEIKNYLSSINFLEFLLNELEFSKKFLQCFLSSRSLNFLQFFKQFFIKIIFICSFYTFYSILHRVSNCICFCFCVYIENLLKVSKT